MSMQWLSKRYEYIMIVYRAINRLNGKYYIGKTIKSLTERVHRHEIFARLKNYPTSYFYNAIKKYGIENFEWEILCSCNTYKELNKKEKYYIKKLNSTNRNIGYNINTGGCGGDNFTNHPDKELIRQKISKSQTGKKRSDAFKKQSSERQLGRILSDEIRDKISKGLTGRIISPEHRLKISNSLKGRNISDEIKEKISNTTKGKKKSPEHARKIAEARTGKKLKVDTKLKIKNSWIDRKENKKYKEFHDGISKIKITISLLKHKNIGILGGAFNPITLGHIQLAEYILKNSEINMIFLTPCNTHVFNKKMVSSEHRLNMCNLAIKNNRKIKVFDYEISNKLSGQTFDLINSLRSDAYFGNKNINFSMIIGQDNANTFDKWYNYKELEKLIRFVVVPRTGVPVDVKSQWYFKHPHIYLDSDKPIIEVSSTKVREYLSITHPDTSQKDHDILLNYLDPAVLDYIIEHKLYGVG